MECGDFKAFKGVLRRGGLSDDEGERRAFLKIVSELISMGRGLLAQMGEDAADILNQAAISLDNFNACLEFLELQERTALWKPDAEMGRNIDSAVASLANSFTGGNQAASTESSAM